MRAFGRSMAGDAMIEAARVERIEDRRGSGSDIAVEDDRHAFDARRQDRANHRRDFATAEPAQDFERIGEMILVQGDRLFDDGDLAGEPCIVEAGATADPIGSGAAVERVIYRRRDRRIADAISPSTKRSAPPAIASMPKATVAAQAFSSNAAVSLMSAVGISRASSNTLRPRP